MGPHLHDWLNLILRFVHLVTGIAWIGSSFYFIWLDSAFLAPEKARHNVDGELYMVHGGFYYQVEKKKIAPGELPSILHWFKWEATLTWLSGFLLLCVVYYMTNGMYLIDKNISSITPLQASLMGISLIVVSWLFYDFLWQSRLVKYPKTLSAFSILVLGLMIYWLCHTLSGRGAYIHVGAIFGTMMVLNVWVRILPVQQKMLDEARAGQTPDYSQGLKAKRRSVHNTYMTFPVLFIMLSNHYPSTYSHPQNWLVLLLIITAGALIRHTMVTKNILERWLLVPAIIILVLVIVMTAPSQRGDAKVVKRATAIEFPEVQVIIHKRCVTCHSIKPVDDEFDMAPVGVTFDNEEEIRNYLPRIYERAVVTKTMPLANKTNITPEERAIIGQWIEAQH